MAQCIPLVFQTFQHSEEEQMARIFCVVANEYFNGIEGKVYVVPSLRKGRDMDLVVWMHFQRHKETINTGYLNNPGSESEKEYKRRMNRDIWFNSLFMVIELKKHNTQDSLSISNGKLFVKYGNEFKNASDQNFDQVFHLQSFLSERLNLSKSLIPKIQNFIWLNRCIDKPHNYDDLDNVIYGELNLNSLLEQICRISPPVSFDEGKNVSFTSCKPEVIDLLDNYFDELKKEKANGLGLITRNKMDLILKKEIDVENNSKLKEIGEKLTIIKGKPGTGKTLHLIHLAYHLKNEEYKPIILTYNKALVQDIDRMMQHSGYSGVIEIKTIHSFFYNILYKNELINIEEIETYDYSSKLQVLLDLVGNEKGIEIRELLKINYDTILVDEAQDCDELERELILRIFEYPNLVLSVGSRQIVREKEIDWTQSITRKNINVINLAISHRNKKDLVDFFNAFSKTQLTSSIWDLKENRNLTGGKLIVTLSSIYSKSFHNQLVKDLIDKGNSMYDLMFLTPSETDKKNYAAELSQRLDEWDIRSFNNTLKENKNKPFSINEHRILNYQSCRGLEAWILVCWNLDTIVRNIKMYSTDSDKAKMELHLNNWLLMIFTRAIDTLVFTFEDYNSDEAKMILNLVNSDAFGHMSEIKQ